jgi:hypothetical protein
VTARKIFAVKCAFLDSTNMVGVCMGEEQVIDLAKVPTPVVQASSSSHSAVYQNVLVNQNIGLMILLRKEAAYTHELEGHCSPHW